MDKSDKQYWKICLWTFTIHAFDWIILHPCTMYIQCTVYLHVCIIHVDISQPDDIASVCDGGIVHWVNGANQPDNTWWPPESCKIFGKACIGPIFLVLSKQFIWTYIGKQAGGKSNNSDRHNNDTDRECSTIMPQYHIFSPVIQNIWTCSFDIIHFLSEKQMIL